MYIEALSDILHILKVNVCFSTQSLHHLILVEAKTPGKMDDLFKIFNLCSKRAEEILLAIIEIDPSEAENLLETKLDNDPLSPSEIRKSPVKEEFDGPLIPASKLSLLQNENLYNLSRLTAKIETFKSSNASKSASTHLPQLRRLVEDLRLQQNKKIQIENQLEQFTAARLLDFTPQQIAKQITLVDFSIFKRIHPNELSHCAWTKPDKREKAPNVIASMDFFNFLSQWTQYEIISASSISESAQVFTFLVNVLVALLDVCNFNSMKAIVSGLTASPVHRLKQVKSLVNKKVLLTLENMETMVSERKNYSYFRSVLEKKPSPSVPFLGLYLHVNHFKFRI